MSKPTNVGVKLTMLCGNASGMIVAKIPPGQSGPQSDVLKIWVLSASGSLVSTTPLDGEPMACAQDSGGEIRVAYRNYTNGKVGLASLGKDGAVVWKTDVVVSTSMPAARIVQLTSGFVVSAAGAISFVSLSGVVVWSTPLSTFSGFGGNGSVMIWSADDAFFVATSDSASVGTVLGKIGANGKPAWIRTVQYDYPLHGGRVMSDGSLLVVRGLYGGSVRVSPTGSIISVSAASAFPNGNYLQYISTTSDGFLIVGGANAVRRTDAWGNTTCGTGGCASKVITTCDQGTVCVTDSCDPKLGCTHKNNINSCSDGNPCTYADKCTSGVCMVTPSPAPTCALSPIAAGATMAGCNPAVDTIPASATTQGCNPIVDTDCAADESPAHGVTLAAFAIDQKEVSNTQFAACVTAGKCTIPATSSSSCTYGKTGKDAFPVNCVTHDQALAYCKWAYGDGRLPTEAEWERAARATDARKYPWGNQEPDCSYADFTPASGACASGPKATGSYASGKSAEGAFDLAGNVREWVADWYDAAYYASAPASNPTGPASGTARVVRGGGYQSDAVGIRGGARGSSDPATTSPSLGFRCARSGM